MSKPERETTEEERSIFAFLDIIRESGMVNMLGSGTLVREQFKLTRKESYKILALWMKNYNEEGDYENIKT